MTPLPNIPTFIYGDDVTFTLDLPSTPWIRALRSVGGDIEADSGVRSGFIVRTDELLTFTLRFHEELVPDVQAFIDFAQTGVSFIWFPDSNDLTTSFTVSLDAPASGSTYQTALDEFPRVQLLTITILEPGIPDIPWEGLPEFEPREEVITAVHVAARLVIAPEINPLDEGDTIQLVPTFYDILDQPVLGIVPTSWESDNELAASVDTNGLVTANDGLPFVLQQQNEFDALPWSNTGTAVEDADIIHDIQFTRVFSGSLPKQLFVIAPEFDGEFYYVTVFVRPDGGDGIYVPGTYEGAIVDNTTNTDRARWRFTITAGGAIALTTVTGTNIRASVLTDSVRAFTFRTAVALVDSHSYEFRLRDAGTAASILCAYAIITASQDAVAEVIAKYDHTHPTIHLTSNASIQFVDDSLITVYVPSGPGFHINGTFTVFGVGGGGGGSFENGGSGGTVDGNTFTADADVVFVLGTGGASGSVGTGGTTTTVTLLPSTQIVTAAGGGGAGTEFGGSNGAGFFGGGRISQGCPNLATAGGGAGGAGANGHGHDGTILSSCNGCFCAAGAGGDGRTILFEHRIIATLGGGGGGRGSHSGTCGASPGPPGFVGGGLGGDNGSGSPGIPGFGGGGGNGQAGSDGQFILIFRRGEAVIS